MVCEDVVDDSAPVLAFGSLVIQYETVSDPSAGKVIAVEVKLSPVWYAVLNAVPPLIDQNRACGSLVICSVAFT